MGNDILYSPLAMAILLSKYNINVIKKDDGSLILAQFTGETTYIPLGQVVGSYSELFEMVCEVTIQVHNTIKNKGK